MVLLPIPPQVKFWPILGCFDHSNQFWKISSGMGILAGTSFGFKKNLSSNYVVLHLKSDVHRSIHTCKASILTRSKALNSKENNHNPKEIKKREGN